MEGQTSKEPEDLMLVIAPALLGCCWAVAEVLALRQSAGCGGQVHTFAYTCEMANGEGNSNWYKAML